MENKKHSIKIRMYFFIICTILLVALCVSTIAFIISSKQIDNFYKKTTTDNACNFASTVDGDYINKLKDVVLSDEYQQLRNTAEETENEKLIEDYLKEKQLWNEYKQIRSDITNYINNMSYVKYIYIVYYSMPNAEATQDMYLIDDETTSLCETGYWEERETELLGIDIKKTNPTISHGDWGWLCSDYYPICDSDGNCIALVGCDIGMEDVMSDRYQFLGYLITSTIIMLVIILIGAIFFVDKTIVSPLNIISNKIKEFKPSKNIEEAHVIEFSGKHNDEINEIYNNTRTMQLDIIRYLNDLELMQNDIKIKEEKINKLSVETYKDALTGVRNKTAYIKKVEEINKEIANQNYDFGLIMIDMNQLKQINDEYGHKAGDLYIKGGCNIICETFKHSPVYRIGGDEFVVILQGQDFINRKEIFKKFIKKLEDSYNQKDKEPWERFSAATGMAECASSDVSLEFVFKRADKEMYLNKNMFKEKYNCNN